MYTIALLLYIYLLPRTHTHTHTHTHTYTHTITHTYTHTHTHTHTHTYVYTGNALEAGGGFTPGPGSYMLNKVTHAFTPPALSCSLLTTPPPHPLSFLVHMCVCIRLCVCVCVFHSSYTCTFPHFSEICAGARLPQSCFLELWRAFYTCTHTYYVCTCACVCICVRAAIPAVLSLSSYMTCMCTR
jgi:hypothetical protein